MKSEWNWINLSVPILLAFFLSALKVCGQFNGELKSFNLVKEEENVIQNVNHLDDFFQKLCQLKTTGKGNVNIVHIGDSHIQADFLTEVVRKNLQREFGNAGRGLIVPGRVAGTNEPLNIRTSSRQVWNAKRCVHPNQPLPIGIGGITISTNQSNASFDLRMNDTLWDNRFNKVTLFYQKDERSFDFLFLDSAFQEIGALSNPDADSFFNYSSVALPGLFSKVSVQTLSRTADQNQAIIFGLNLENGNHGVLYHAIGVNGAKYAHYNAATLFAEQTKVLQPDLFIISLGTNEAVEYPYADGNFSQHVSKLIQSLSLYNPDAKFMIVSPPDAFRKKIKFNPGIEVVRDHLLQFAVENGFAFWDMYKVNGGKNSATQWKSEGLLRPDGVHFTREGYAYQGNLLYQAIMKAYQQYILMHSPNEKK